MQFHSTNKGQIDHMLVTSRAKANFKVLQATGQSYDMTDVVLTETEQAEFDTFAEAVFRRATESGG